MKNIKNKIMLAGLALAASAALQSPAQATGGKGMTWRVYDFASSTNAGQQAAWGNLPRNVVVVGCQNGSPTGCNAYQGDTPIAETRRIMCFVPGSAAEPAGYAAVFSGTAFTNTASSNWRFYFGWSGGQIGLSKPYAGSTLTSRAVGDELCKKDLRDPAARMIEHHDNKVGGWALGGTIHPNSEAKEALLSPTGSACGRPEKYWAAINDQPANPWNP